MHLHILGICGTFMGGLAALAREAGHRVTGCDAGVYPPMSDQLRALGIELIEGYGADQLALKPDVFVVGNVVSRARLPDGAPKFPLMEAILDAGLPYTSGPQWLLEHVLQGRHVLAVAGTHGKTTTTSMLTWVLEHAGLQPGFLVGGVPLNFGISARLGGQAAGQHRARWQFCLHHLGKHRTVDREAIGQHENVTQVLVRQICRQVARHVVGTAPADLDHGRTYPGTVEAHCQARDAGVADLLIGDFPRAAATGDNRPRVPLDDFLQGDSPVTGEVAGKKQQHQVSGRRSHAGRGIEPLLRSPGESVRRYGHRGLSRWVAVHGAARAWGHAG